MSAQPLRHEMTHRGRRLISDIILSVLILYFHTLTSFAVITILFLTSEYLAMSALPLRHEMTHGGSRLIIDIIISVIILYSIP